MRFFHFQAIGYVIALALLSDAFQLPSIFIARSPITRRVHLSRTRASNNDEIEEVDVAIVGAGIGGLCAGAILNTLYNKKVGIYESHYLPGGCAHAFERSAKVGDTSTTFTFDSGPTILLGCSKRPYNPLQQVSITHS